jgi:hypothetical protein
MKYFSSLILLVSAIFCSVSFAAEKIPSDAAFLDQGFINPFPLLDAVEPLNKPNPSLRTEFLPFVDDVFIRWYWYKDAACTDFVQEVGFRTNHCVPYSLDSATPNAKVVITAIDSNGWTIHQYGYQADCVSPVTSTWTTKVYTVKKMVCKAHSNGYYYKVNVAGGPESDIAGGAVAQYYYPTEQACRLSKKSTSARAVMTISYPLGLCQASGANPDIRRTSCDDNSYSVNVYLASSGAQCTDPGTVGAVVTTTRTFASTFCTAYGAFWYQHTCIEESD